MMGHPVQNTRPFCFFPELIPSFWGKTKKKLPKENNPPLYTAVYRGIFDNFPSDATTRVYVVSPRPYIFIHVIYIYTRTHIAPPRLVSRLANLLGVPVPLYIVGTTTATLVQPRESAFPKSH